MPGPNKNFESVDTGSLLFNEGFEIVEDDNSPLTISSAISGSITLSDTYEVVYLIQTEGSGNAGVYEMQVNGDTGTNYDYELNDGTETSGASAIPAGVWSQCVGNTFTLSGSWSGGWSLGVRQQSIANVAVSAQNSNITSPLTSITIQDDGGENASATFRVLGVPQ